MKKKLPVLFTILSLLIAFISNAQPGLEWQKNYGGSVNDSAYSIQPTTDGGYIVAGSSNSTSGDVTGNHGGMDYWVAKLDGAGNILWQKSFGGSGSDIARCIQQTSDGGYIIAGISNSIDGDVTDHGRSFSQHVADFHYIDVPPVYEPWIVKLDNTGAKLWAVCLHKWYYVDPETWFVENYVSTIIQTSDGGYLVGGNTPTLPDDPDYGLDAVMLVKLTNTGSVSWSKNIMKGGRMDIRSLVETSSGYAAAGYAYSFGSHGGTDMLIFKTDFAGNWTWGLEFGGSADDKAYHIQKTSDGGFIVAGVAGSSDGDLLGAGNHGGDDYCLVKLSSAGVVNWSKCFGGATTDVARAVQQTADGGYLVAGYSYSNTGQVTGHTPESGKGQSDYWIAKIDYAGTFISGQCYGGSANDNAGSMAKTLDGGFIIAGSSASTDAGFINKGGADYWLLKLYGCGNVRVPLASNQAFCKGAIVADLVASGINLKWYNTAVGGVPLSPATNLLTGNYYVSQTTAHGCESGRTAVSVKINAIPGAPVAPLNQSFLQCTSPRVSNLTATGTNLKWYAAASGGAPLASSTLLNNQKYYVSQTSIYGCESSRVGVSVTIKACILQARVESAGVASPETVSASVNVFPNPSSGEKVTVNIHTANQSDNAIIQVMDLKGKLLLQETAINNKGNIQQMIDVSTLPSGIYLVRFAAGLQSGTIKLIVAK